MPHKADLIDADTWHWLLKPLRHNPDLAEGFARYLSDINTEVLSGPDRAQAIAADLRQGARIAYLHSRIHMAAQAMFLLWIKGKIPPENEPLPLLLDALRKQRDLAESAGELRFIDGVLNRLTRDHDDDFAGAPGDDDADELRW